jgi:O-antigen/teichoic acid export membrane protein
MSDTFQIADVEASVEAPRRKARVLKPALLRDWLSYFGSKVVPGFMGLASVPVFIRLIGLDEYGRFAVIAPVLMAVAGASSGWLAQGILRFHPVAGDPSSRQTAFDRAVTGGTVASVLVTSLVLGVILVGLRYRLYTSLVLLAFCLSLLVYTVGLSRFQAKLRPMSVLRREIIRSTAGFIVPVVIVTITGRKRFEMIVLGQAVAYTIAILPIFGSRSQAHESASDVAGDLQPSVSSGSMVRQLWRYGWAVGLWLLLSQALPVVDRWTIQRFASFTSAGIYASLYEIAIRSFSFLVFPLTQAAHPRIMRAWNEGQFAESYRIIRYSILSQLAIFGAVLGAVSLFAPRMTRLVLGFDDPIATRMLPILLVGGFLWQLALLLHKPLEIAQRTGAMLGAMVASYILVLSASSYIFLTLCMTRFRTLRRFPSPSPY